MHYVLSLLLNQLTQQIIQRTLLTDSQAAAAPAPTTVPPTSKQVYININININQSINSSFLNNTNRISYKLTTYPILSCFCLSFFPYLFGSPCPEIGVCVLILVRIYFTCLSLDSFPHSFARSFVFRVPFCSTQTSAQPTATLSIVLSSIVFCCFPHLFGSNTAIYFSFSSSLQFLVVLVCFINCLRFRLPLIGAIFSTLTNIFFCSLHSSPTTSLPIYMRNSCSLTHSQTNENNFFYF